MISRPAYNASKTSAGYSLLEMIIVLGIIGFIMAGVGVYVNKRLDIHHRYQVASAVADEVAGLLRYVNTQGEISYTTDGDPQKRTALNPFYDPALVERKRIVDPNTHFMTMTTHINPIFYGFYANATEAGKGAGMASTQLTPTTSPITHNPYYYKEIKGLNDYVSPFIKRVYYSNDGLAINNDGVSQILNPGTGDVIGVRLNAPITDWANVRAHFTDNSCHDKKGKAVNFLEKSFLKCRMSDLLGNNAPLRIGRLDFVNKDKGTLPRSNQRSEDTSISRVDVYLEFHGTAKDQFVGLNDYLVPLQEAFRQKGVMPEEMYVTLRLERGVTSSYAISNGERTGFDATYYQMIDMNIYPQFTKPGVKPARTPVYVTLANLPQHINQIIQRKPGGRQTELYFGIRLLFPVGDGEFLRPDGSVMAGKLCWSAKDRRPGPCLSSMADGSGLVLTDSTGTRPADLQAGAVVLMDKDTDGRINEIYTAPHIQYMSFTNTLTVLNGLAPCYIDYDAAGGPKKDCHLPGSAFAADTDRTLRYLARSPRITPNSVDNGAIVIPRQQCPVSEFEITPDGKLTRPAQPIQLYPRLSVVPSSFLAGSPVEYSGGSHDKNTAYPNYENPSEIYDAPYARPQTPDQATLAIGRLGGVSLQINGGLYKSIADHDHWDRWVITAIVATETLQTRQKKGYGWEFYNPTWLSVQVSTWCSSEPQYVAPAPLVK